MDIKNVKFFNIKIPGRRTAYIILVSFILVSGIFIRFWQLNDLPPGIQYDEAYNGLNALDALETGNFKIFYPENTGREGFHINVTALFIKIFGNINMSLRVANAIWGSLTLLGFFFLLRELRFSPLSVILGTFMLSFSFWHLDFSRTAYRAIMVPMVLIWTFYFFSHGISHYKHKYFNLALAGLIFGLGFHTYIAFRIAPLIFILIALALMLVKKSFWKNHGKTVFLVAGTSLVVALPIFIYYAENFKEFLYRSDTVSIFNTSKMTPWQAFWKSLGVHLWAFFVHGDNNARHNWDSQPLLPAAWAVLFALGFIISLREIIKTIWYTIRYRLGKIENKIITRWYYVSILAQSTFWVMLVPGIMSIEGIPHSLRIIGTIPGVFLLCLLPLEYFLNLYRRVENLSGTNGKTWPKNQLKTILVGLILMVFFGGFSQVYIYFTAWANDTRTYGGYERKLYDMGIMIKEELPMHKNNYIITAFNTAITPGHKQSSLKTVEYLAYPEIKSYIFYKPMDGRMEINCDDPLLVFQESDQWLRDQYKEKCPNLKQKRYNYDGGKYQFWVMSYD